MGIGIVRDCKKLRIIDLFFRNLLKMRDSGENGALGGLKNIPIVAYWVADRSFHYPKEGRTETNGLPDDRFF